MPRGQGPARRDALIVAGLVIVAAVLLVTARTDGGPPAAANPRGPGLDAALGGTLDQESGSAVALPPGWHEVARPLTDVTVPVQVFAAATYPIVLDHHPRGCGPPPRALAEMPPGGVLLQVIEYPPRSPTGRPIAVPRLPRRPERFSWDDAGWGRYECAGPSYKFDYRQEGRALQAQVWVHRDTVDPRLRAGALLILDRFR